MKRVAVESKISRAEAMKYLGISSTMLARLEAENLIKHVRIPAGNKTTIWHKTNWLDEFLNKHTVEAI